MNVTGETLEERQNGMHLKDFSYKSNNMKLMETPVADKGKNPRISTPPESVMLSSRKISVFNTPTFKGNDVKEVSQKNQKTALLSPAFSSPQPKSLDADYPPPKPTFVPSSSFSSDDDHQSKTKKRGKKSRKAAKERSFNFDSNDKPPYSYATLIGMSILSNLEKKLTLSQIYLWISDTFKYYKRDEVGWQNSIRHNLSLNKAFIKGEKSKDGKGHFWCIKSGCEEQFLKSRANKNSSYQDLMDQIYSSVKSTKRSMNSIPSSPTMNSDHQDDDGADSRQQKKRKVSESISYDEEDDDDSNDENYHSRSSDERGSDSPELTANDSLNSLPELDPPFSHSNKSLTKHLENSNGPPLFIISDSPDKPLLAGKNLTYTSSFSCSTNLELSPIQPTDNGPLLEPLTPVNNIYNAPQNNSHSRSILSTHLSFPPLNSLQNHFHHSITNTSTSAHHFPQKTPKSGVIRTPLKIIKTPQTNSLMKKFWNSPSYLDEFYYSPLTGSSATILNSYDDDDMILRNMEHHQQLPNSIAKSHQVFHTSRNLIHDFKKVETRDSDSLKENKSPSTEIDE